MLAYIYSRELQAASDQLPSNVGRSSLIHQLVSSLGILSQPEVVLLNAKTAHREDLLKVHGEHYVTALLKERQSGDKVDQEELATFGLEYDCPVFDELPSYALLVAGSTLTAARALQTSTFTAAINWDGGRHHARRNAASGFCYVQDIVLGLQELRKTFSRIMYIDLDLHHGDGVELAFSHSERVLTLSLHRHEKGFFPNTGNSTDCGKGKGKSFALNIPLKRGLSDESLAILLQEVILPAFDAYKPPALIVQCGVDGLALDPCNEWNLSIAGLTSCIQSIHQVALSSGAKVMFLGGGGYNPALASRCYANITAAITKTPMPADIPEHELWHAYESTNHEFRLNQKSESMKDENIASLPQIIATARSQIAQIEDNTRKFFN